MKKEPGLAIIHSETLLFRINEPLRRLLLPALDLESGAKEALKSRDKVGLYVSALSLLMSLLSRVPIRLTGVVISSTFGRFGNQLIQICTAIGLATELVIRNVHLPRGSLVQFTNPAEVLDIALHRETRYHLGLLNGLIAIGNTLTRKKSVLVGRFFELRLLPQLWPKIESQRPHILHQIGHNFFSSDELKGLGPNHLVVHLRGGDVFATDSPPKKYGQPPIGFYERVIAIENPSSVTIVSEDTSNPTLVEIVAFCERRGTEVRLQTSSFDKDLQTLLSAHVICSSRGTFIEQVAGLSHHLKKIYLFGFDRFLRKDLEVIRVIDGKGEFWTQNCENNWNNTPTQRLAMVTYHEENMIVHN